MAEAADQINLESPPDDGITTVRFSPQSSNHLLVSSWDSHVRLYDIAENSVKASFQHQAAVLGCAFAPTGKQAFSGGLDTYLRRLDLETETIKIIGGHSATISSVLHSPDPNVVITGSWDRTVKMWDQRKGNPRSLISSHDQSERIYAMDIVEHTLVVAAAGRRIAIFDTRNMSATVQERVSALKFTTSALACMSDGNGYATASVEGRIAVEYLDPSAESQARKYAFKCHRQTIPEGDLVCPVNALAFHPIHNTFASGGSDGVVSIWDHTAKKRLRQYPRFHTGVSALAFSGDGAKMAIGVSYNWDVADEQRRDELKKRGDKMDLVGIVVRNVGDEAKPKVQQSAA